LLAAFSEAVLREYGAATGVEASSVPVAVVKITVVPFGIR
jgi:hypothetical protein